MPRELNPELFGQRKSQYAQAPAMATAMPTAHATAHGMPHTMSAMQPAPVQMPTSPSVVEFEMAEQYRRKIRDLENQVSVLTQKVEKLASHLEQRITQVSHAQKAFESQNKDQFREVYEAQAAATSKLTERRVADAKIQEMIDRHNQLVLNFEQRMSQIHKVASEQEMKVMTYQATIDEILREIRNSRR